MAHGETDRSCSGIQPSAAQTAGPITGRSLGQGVNRLEEAEPRPAERMLKGERKSRAQEGQTEEGPRRGPSLASTAIQGWRGLCDTLSHCPSGGMLIEHKPRAKQVYLLGSVTGSEGHQIVYM